MAFPDGWGRKCELVIQHGQVSATLSNFPALVAKDTLPSEIFDADGSYPALNGGGDIRFSSNSDGSTQLACEIEQFVTDNNPANGKAAIWVKVPSVASAANTSIWIWYNKAGESQPAEGATYGKHAVWDSNFEIVQHMNQDPSGSSPQMIDSTNNSNDGASAGTMTTADLVDGKIGKGIDFDGANDSINASAINWNPITFTVEFWINPDTRTNYNQTIGAVNGWGSFKFHTTSDGGIYTGINAYSRFTPTQLPANTLTTGSSQHFVFTCLDIPGTQWEGKFYKNGSLLSTKDQFSMSDPTVGNWGGFKVGVANTDTVDGIIDEVRVSDVVRSAGWIETEYNNQNSPATFIIEGTPETPGGGAANAPTGIFYGPLYGPFFGPIG